MTAAPSRARLCSGTTSRVPFSELVADHRRHRFATNESGPGPKPEAAIE